MGPKDLLSQWTLKTSSFLGLSKRKKNWIGLILGYPSET